MERGHQTMGVRKGKNTIRKAGGYRAPISDVTILIQGELQIDSPVLKHVHKWAKIHYVIISHYENEPEHIYHPSITYVRQLQNIKTHDAKEYLRSQCLTSIKGLEAVKTPYVIRLRTDEYYNLDKFIEQILANPGKLVSNNFLFCADRFYKFHPSDHLLGGQTLDMLDMFRICLLKLSYGIWERLPEIMLMTSFLQLKGEDIDQEKSKELMKRNVVLVPCDDLEPLYITDPVKQEVYRNAQDIYRLGYCIRNMNLL